MIIILLLLILLLLSIPLVLLFLLILILLLLLQIITPVIIGISTINSTASNNVTVITDSNIHNNTNLTATIDKILVIQV